jgi:hypothetical protein
VPTRREKIEAIMQDDADEARAASYESTAQAHERRLADYRAGNGQQAGGQQQGTGQATG